MTSAQPTALGAVTPGLPEATNNQVNLGWLRVFDNAVMDPFSSRAIDCESVSRVVQPPQLCQLRSPDEHYLRPPYRHCRYDQRHGSCGTPYKSRARWTGRVHSRSAT